MKTLISTLILLLGLLFACKPTPKQETAVKPAATDTVEQVGKPVPQAWQRLTSMVGEYMYDSVLFKLPAVHDSLQAILPPEVFKSMQTNWNVASELKRTNNILCVSGCKHNACFSNMWILMVDIANSVMNVYHIEDHKMTVYKGRQLITLPEGLENYMTTMKKNGKVAESDIVIE